MQSVNHLSSTASFTVGTDGGQMHIQVSNMGDIPAVSGGGYVDDVGFTGTFDENQGNAHDHLDYANVQIDDDPTAVTTSSNSQYLQSTEATEQTLLDSHTVLDNVAPILGVPDEDTGQNDLEMEPIDLEEVQKIQARMPAADPNAPVGSNKNPIRIIQQGNQYITTQDVSDEHLQQIIQVLTNQALISRSGSRPSTIYNRLTNRRIVFRVTRAKRRSDDTSNAASVGSSTTFDRTSIAGRMNVGERDPFDRNKRRKRNSDEDPDFEPEAPEEEILPFPLARQASTAGRVSKPPKHLLKDYKHLRLESMASKPDSSDEDEDDDRSDGGYSDCVNEDVSAASSEEGTGKGLQWPCPECSRVFSSRAGMTRHQTLTHASGTTRANKARLTNPFMASMKRRAKVKSAVSEATDDELVEFAAARLAKLVTPWDHLLMRNERGSPALPHVPHVIRDYLCLADRVQSFLADQLQPATNQPTGSAHERSNGSQLFNNENGLGNADSMLVHTDGGGNIKETCPGITLQDVNEGFGDLDENSPNSVLVGSNIQSVLLGLPMGRYFIREPLYEEHMPRRFRSALASRRVAAANASVESKRSMIAMETADDDEVGATLRSDVPEHVNIAGGTADSQDVVALGDELLLIPEGGLGVSIPDEWLASGAFLAVLMENGQTSDLVMEAATGRLFHRPTGHLVSLSTDGQSAETTLPIPTTVPLQDPTDPTADTLCDPEDMIPGLGYEDEQEQQQQHQELEEEEEEEDIPLESPPPAPKSVKKKRRSAESASRNLPSGGRKSQPDPFNVGDGREEREKLLEQLAESGDPIDLDALFPGVTVTEVSPGVCLVTKPNGDRFNVEHGGEGITLETLQTILQMET